MSTGTICLTCRRYINTEPKWKCQCPVPVPSDDAKTPNADRKASPE